MALCFGSRGPWLILRKMMVCFHPTLPLRTGQHCSKKQEIQNTQIVLTYCKKNCSGNQEKVLKFEAEG